MSDTAFEVGIAYRFFLLGGGIIEGTLAMVTESELRLSSLDARQLFPTPQDAADTAGPVSAADLPGGAVIPRQGYAFASPLPKAQQPEL